MQTMQVNIENFKDHIFYIGSSNRIFIFAFSKDFKILSITLIATFFFEQVDRLETIELMSSRRDLLRSSQCCSYF